MKVIDVMTPEVISGTRSLDGVVDVVCDLEFLERDPTSRLPVGP